VQAQVNSIEEGNTTLPPTASNINSSQPVFYNCCAPNSSTPPTQPPWNYANGGQPPPRGRQVNQAGPFQGDFAGSSWNPTALFAQNTSRRNLKMSRCRKLIHKHDFTIIQEAHSLVGRADALKLSGEFTALWSDCSASTAGIGIILNNNFLKQFDAITRENNWIEIIKGYVAILKLKGPEGNLDIFCCYFPTGDSSYATIRKDVSHTISQHIAPQSEVLTILCGDFNFVEHDSDRWNLEGGEWSGSKDAGEAEFFQEKVCHPHGLAEWEQGQFTHENARARSRLDRIYCNQHVSIQFDRNIICAVLEWEKGTSAHRPISFRRITPAEKNPDDKPIPDSEFRREGWQADVLNHFQFLCINEQHLNNPIRRLLLLKDSIRNVYDLHKGEFKEPEEGSLPDDKLGFTMSCLRAVGRGRWNLANRCAESYPKLREWIHKDKHFINPQESNSLRDHAVQLYREQVNNEIHSLNLVEEEGDKAKAKESILRKLKRLAPGSTPGLNAMKCEDGSISTSPEDIVRTLRDHWKGVFSRKEVKHLSVQIWMEELFVRDANGCFITGLPGKQDNCWRVTRKAVKTAIHCAKNSMPGPDGIPSGAYKQLCTSKCKVAEDILFDVAVALGSGDFKQHLNEAYSDRSISQTHDFNLSLLCCLPKKPYGSDPEAGDYYRGEDTRPLALVNVDNRIIASAARHTWEPLLNKYISKAQQGFLKGRQMINNIICIDHDAMTVSLRH